MWIELPTSDSVKYDIQIQNGWSDDFGGGGHDPGPAGTQHLDGPGQNPVRLLIKSCPANQNH